MQRQTLVPIHYYMRGRDPSRTSVLDLACGTGRFLTFLKDNYPSARTYGVDLSPNYLKAAEENMDYFERFDMQVNGFRKLSRPRYIQASAESLPFGDRSLDVVTCVYLFHELPPEARRAAIAEVSRVLEPGGIFVWTDSLQEGDRPESAPVAALFRALFHEPYFASFLRADFEGMCAAAGLAHEATILAHLSKASVLMFQGSITIIYKLLSCFHIRRAADLRNGWGTSLFAITSVHLVNVNELDGSDLICQISYQRS
ncbi:hypothetical protein KFL_003340060 [Klebsormidium nitens]|uniref:Methyltransferase domain-containing protein n=1 Tax=Klebsormidium nitens TaxID=105231 RepID=A0A1Y1IAZ8_KLENI|nr:hypothetical protein KFL_003340060 [Klebsormidium nitens]|eukprot:GAQ87142.1 hypothetical protein KFL_003340060 [Klebsormidium nitens]